jgi:hypothetical protein
MMVNSPGCLLRHRAMRGVITELACAAAMLVAIAAGAGAAQYPGWSDTGWVYASKRECCRAAIEVAAEYSAHACIGAGGVPRTFAGASQRGTCSSEWTQNGGAVLYRCYGDASVSCR